MVVNFAGLHGRSCVDGPAPDRDAQEASASFSRGVDAAKAFHCGHAGPGLSMPPWFAS
jgi:hypothetical protein